MQNHTIESGKDGKLDRRKPETPLAAVTQHAPATPTALSEHLRVEIEDFLRSASPEEKEFWQGMLLHLASRSGQPG